MDSLMKGVSTTVDTDKTTRSMTWKSKFKYEKKYYSCGTVGHIFYDYPKGTRQKKCAGCESEQHTQGQCKDSPSTSALNQN